MQIIRNQKGYSIIEILVVVGILAILMTLATINILGATRRVYENTSAATLVADLKSQQVKAMNGDTGGSNINSNYGVHFETTKYTLFRGDSYSLNNPTNFSITLPTGTQLTNILFPSSQIIFASGSGEIIGFSNGNNSLTISNISDNNLKTVIINRLGVITSN